jgi:uncharacterized protein
MKLDESPRSDNVEDARGSGIGRGAGVGIGTIVIVVIGYFMGINPATLLGLLNGDQQSVTAPAQAPTAADSNDPQVDFVRAILGDTEVVWGAYFQNMGKVYTRPKLVLFSQQVNSACGLASTAAGPFYCSGDQKVYIDLAFYRQLATEFGAPGEFARAYVIAHEVGHHVQNLLGTTAKVDAKRRQLSEKDYDKLSVRLELQADFYAGVWAHDAQKMKHILQPGDIESALNAAHQIGDDYLQKRGRGYVTPDSFTHGTSEQRMRWFKKGFDTGDISQGDTFSVKDKDL